MVRAKVVAIIGMSVWLSACTLPSLPMAAPSPTATIRPTATVTRTAIPIPTPTPAFSVQGLATAPDGAQSPIMAAVAALAQSLDLPSDAEVTVRSVTEKDWSDSSLGCPQPGMVYAQVVTPGFVVILEVDGVEYTYHTDRRESVVSCDTDTTDRATPASRR